MKRRFTMFVVVVASACNRTQPSEPTYVPSPVQLVTRHFSGVVLTEDGGPVPAATVSFTPGTIGGWANATTDGNGSYQMALDQPASWAGTHATVTHPLYDDTVNKLVPWLPSETDVTQNFRLYRSVTLAARESAHLAITPDNAVCGEEGEFLCRKIHVTVPSSGTLVIDSIADDPPNTFWLSIGNFVQYPVQNVIHLSSSVDTATTVVVLVVRPWNIAVAGGFTLKTAFAP